MCLEGKRKAEVKVWPKPGLYRRTPFKIVMITKSRGCEPLVMTADGWVESPDGPRATDARKKEDQVDHRPSFERGRE